MSDGVANVDATDPFAILGSSPDRDARNPLRIITVGVGIQNYNDVLLEQLAQYGNGWYRYLDDPQQAEATFSRDTLAGPVHSLRRPDPGPGDLGPQRGCGPGASWATRTGLPPMPASPRNERNSPKYTPAPPLPSSTSWISGGMPSERQTQDLGTVELRWTDPVTARPWRQHAAVSGHPDADFAYAGDVLLQFGAIVALSSDRYSGVFDVHEEDLGYLYDDLAILLEELDALNRELGRLQSYNDFSFLLETHHRRRMGIGPRRRQRVKVGIQPLA